MISYIGTSVFKVQFIQDSALFRDHVILQICIKQEIIEECTELCIKAWNAKFPNISSAHREQKKLSMIHNLVLYLTRSQNLKQMLNHVFARPMYNKLIDSYMYLILYNLLSDLYLLYYSYIILLNTNVTCIPTCRCIR